MLFLEFLSPLVSYSIEINIYYKGYSSAMKLEDEVKKFVENMDLKSHIGNIDIIRTKFGLATRGDVLAILRENKEQSDFLYEVYAADFYERTPWLQEDRPEYEDRDDLFCLLYENRDKLENNSFAFIALALKYGGKVSEKNVKKWHGEMNAANYAMRMEDVFSKEIKRVYKRMPLGEKRVPEKRRRINLLKRVDRNKFTRLNDPNTTISKRYLRESFRYAMMFYGNRVIEEVKSKLYK